MDIQSTHWAEAEVRTVKFPDKRLSKRLPKILSALSSNPEASIPAIFNDVSQAKSAYRFFASASVSHSVIIKAHADQSLERMKDLDTILVISDTTSLELEHLKATTGLGYTYGKTNGKTNGKTGRGIIIHTAMAVSTEGLPVGIVRQDHWTRQEEDYGKRKNRKSTPVSDKESGKWARAEAAVEGQMPREKHIIMISDRESDVYMYLARKRQQRTSYVIRCIHNRRVEMPEGKLFDNLESLAVSGHMRVELRRTPKRATRTADLEVRYRSVVIKVPKQLKDNPESQTIETNAIDVREVNTAETGKGISWTILTNLPIATVDDAKRVVGYYSQRWLIERFHYTLKSGCKIEEHQFHTAQSFSNATAALSIVAWRLLYLNYSARINPEADIAEYFSEQECEVFTGLHNKSAKSKTKTKPVLFQAMLIIAGLGGYANRKNDGPPGVKALWTGYQRIMHYIEIVNELNPT